jgi:cellulose 1,4-beta-cellobiosidase
MRFGTLLVVLVVGTALSLISFTKTAWATTNWVAHLAAGSKGAGHAQALPSAPTSPAASCNAPTTSKTIKVTWSAVTHATTYSVYDSTTTAGGTYSLIASGVATASWTSGTLTSGTHYWFEVVANIGNNWSSVKSAATGSTTINTLTPFCSQP